MSAVAPAASAARLLLDTHVFLWWADGDLRRMSPTVLNAIATASSIHVSLASAWELTIKSALSKMRLHVTFAEALEINRFSALPITLEHIGQVATLPAHHRDPFDRMLVAQAVHERLTLVTHDSTLGAYDVPVLWA